MPGILRVGDRVCWRGGWGTVEATEATVTSIDRVRYGEKYGNPVTDMPWSEVPRCAVVGLDNGHWAYGKQVTPWTK